MLTTVFSLAFHVEVASTFDEKIEKAAALLKTRTGPAIIYVTLQKHAEQVAEALKQRKYKPLVYHAGLSNEERQRIQVEFMESAEGIVCATIAFGMGIDKGALAVYRPQSSVADVSFSSKYSTGVNQW